MAFKFLQDHAAKRMSEYMSHVKPEFMQWLDAHEVVTYADFSAFCNEHGLNSYERELMYPKLDNDALIRIVKSHLLNCGRVDKRPCSTYDESIIAVFAPLMIERIERFNKNGQAHVTLAL